MESFGALYINPTLKKTLHSLIPFFNYLFIIKKKHHRNKNLDTLILHLYIQYQNTYIYNVKTLIFIIKTLIYNMKTLIYNIKNIFFLFLLSKPKRNKQ